MEKVIFITGASSGIGKETAKLFQAKNWKVAATMRNPDDAKDLGQIVDIECFRVDVSDQASIKTAIDGTIEKFGRIDVVVNNAGYATMGAFEATKPEQIKRQFDVNVFGMMNVCREIIPHFRKQRHGHIVNISSVGGRMAFPFSTPYCGTKWAVEGFSESLQYELEPFNIRVKIIEPGPIKTDFYDRSLDIASNDLYDVAVNKFLAEMRKAGETAPEGTIVAQAVYDAVTDGSRRLRYGVNTKGILKMRRLLPEAAFFKLIKTIFLR